MRSSLCHAAMALLISSPISFFRYERPVRPSGTGQQYVVVDETIWLHARPDLGDLRFYSGSAEVPYSLEVERSGTEHRQIPVSVLQQSTVESKTRFLVDMSAVAEYDHVKLTLAAKNFVAHARVEGSDDAHGKNWALLGSGILYDLSKDRLGSNTMLRIPRSIYKWLRVTIDGPVKPEDILSATSEIAEERSAAWRDVSRSPRQDKNKASKDTILTFSLAQRVPAERVLFSFDPTQGNFQRNVEIEDETGRWIGSGEINRIHIVRYGQKIDSEQYEVSFSTRTPTIKVIVRNGDDPPLKLTDARIQQMERRAYFDAPAGTLLLYYGDEKLQAPVYDYAKLFVRNDAANVAQMDAEQANSAFTLRPDNRPWSERHPMVLWAAIIAAVVILGGIALRSMRSAPAQGT